MTQYWRNVSNSFLYLFPSTRQRGRVLYPGDPKSRVLSPVLFPCWGYIWLIAAGLLSFWKQTWRSMPTARSLSRGQQWCEAAIAHYGISIAPSWIWGLDSGGCFLLLLLCSCLFFRATPVACGRSQPKGWIRAAAASLCHSHDNARSKSHLQPLLQVVVMPDS